MFDLGIIGGGPAGYVAAERAARLGKSVVLFDRKKLGGVCLNEGCIPTKTLLYSAKILDQARDSEKYGISCEGVRYDLGKIMERKNRVVNRLVAGIAASLKHEKVEVINAHADILDRRAGIIRISANQTLFECKNLLLATGSEALIPAIPGLDRDHIITNREILEIDQIPESLTIIGGGVIGMEFASFFTSMGCRVTVIEMLPEILGSTDRELSGMLRQELVRKGTVFHLGSRVTQINGKEVQFEKDGSVATVKSEQVLISVGRKPVVEGFNLEVLGVEIAKGAVKTDDQCRTNLPNVFAAGDINGFSLLAHTASREGEVAVNTICGIPDRMRYNAIPSVVYTNPEIACVGLTEEEASAKGIEYEVRALPLAYSGRFVAENEGRNGKIKILIGKKYQEVLGVHMIGNPASEMIYGAALMIETQMRPRELKQIVFPHPTVSEIIRETLFTF